MKVWSWRQAILKSQLGATTKLLLLTLSTYMNEHGDGCYPSQATLATDTSLSPRAISQHIKIAAKAGFLVVKKRQLKGSKWDANEYEAAYPDGVHLIHPTDRERDAANSTEACTSQQDGVHHVRTNSPENSTKNTSSSAPASADASTNELKKQQILGRTDLPTNLCFDTLPKAWGEYAVQTFGWERQTVLDVWADFVNYWYGKKSEKFAKTDWPATWRNSCRTNAKRFGFAANSANATNKPKPTPEQLGLPVY